MKNFVRGMQSTHTELSLDEAKHRDCGAMSLSNPTEEGILGPILILVIK